MGWRRGLFAIVTFLIVGCTAAPRPVVVDNADPLPDDPPMPHVEPGDPLACVVRAPTPSIDNAFDAKWSPDSKTLVVTRIVTIPNAKTVTGYEEDQRLSTLDVTTGVVRDLGRGSKATWSGIRDVPRVLDRRGERSAHHEERSARRVCALEPAQRPLGRRRPLLLRRGRDP